MIHDIYLTTNYLSNGLRLTQVRVLFLSLTPQQIIWGNYLNFLSPGLFLYNGDNDNHSIFSWFLWGLTKRSYRHSKKCPLSFPSPAASRALSGLFHILLVGEIHRRRYYVCVVITVSSVHSTCVTHDRYSVNTCRPNEGLNRHQLSKEVFTCCFFLPLS